MKWNIIGKLKIKNENINVDQIVDVVLVNRGIVSENDKSEFFDPIHPEFIPLESVGLNQESIDTLIKRLVKAKEDGESVLIYGDYDADGICATAIMWECINAIGIDVLPYIPNRFEEGYGLKADSIEKLKNKNQKLKVIVTVDNGIVADAGVDKANELGIDVIITDHHEEGSRLPNAHSIIHSKMIGGATVAWFVARELSKKFPIYNLQFSVNKLLELACIGSLSDQIPLIGANRSVVKYGLEEINSTNRVGLLEMIRESTLELGAIGTYEIGFVIAPRINAMGRLENAIDSLRLLCTTNKKRAHDLAEYLSKVNKERQLIVEEALGHAKNLSKETKWEGAVILADESYHEGIIGLVASKLVEMYYRPAIVFSKGKEISKASARSISGFNMIEEIRKLDKFLIAGGGHAMAAGFSIKTSELEEFINEFTKLSKNALNDDILQRSLKIDLELDFSYLDRKLLDKLLVFAPYGIGNPNIVFSTSDVKILDVKSMGKDSKHLKLKLSKNDKMFDGIYFGNGNLLDQLYLGQKINIAYVFEENIWNGVSSMQLKIRDLVYER